jgi:predicted ATPase
MSVPASDVTRRLRPLGPFVGREHEMAVLGTALDATIAGHGRLVIVAGEAGIGKSRLAEVFAEESRARGVRVAWGRCWEAGGAPAFWPWVQAFRALIRSLDQQQFERAFASTGTDVARILPDLRGTALDRGSLGDALEESDAIRFELFDSIARSLRELSGEGPILVMLDDLHAADEPSLLLLRFVCGELADAPILFLATYREGDLEPADPRLQRLAELSRLPGSTHVSPRSLSEEAVRQYLERSIPNVLPAGLVDTVHRQTEGNPLFMSEVVRLLVDEQRMERFEGRQRLEIPHGVRAVIGRRLTRLTPEARELLDRASVIGVEVPLDQLTGTRVGPAGEILALLDEAASADVLLAPVRAAGAWRFKHALVREVVYSSLPAAERMRLHLEVAEVLEELHRDDPDPPHAVIAHHYVEAVPTAEPRRGVDHSRRAAQQATEQAAHEEAMRLYRQALSITEGRDTIRVDLLIGLGEAAARAGDQVASRAAHLQAADLAEKLGLIEGLATAAVGYGGRFGWLRAGADPVLVPLLERALRALPGSDSRFRVRLLARLAGALRGDSSMDRRIRRSTG